MEQVGLHQKMIENEEDTPFFNDSKDDTSLPKKRGKHDSDFDSSEQKPDLDFYLPKQKPARSIEWCKLFQYRCFKIEYSDEVFKEMTTECEEEIKALKKAHNKARHLIMTEFAGLKKDRHCRITSEVLKTILDNQKVAYDCICRAEGMLHSVKADVETYIKFKDDILVQRKLKWDAYFENVEHLAEKPNVDKMIQYLKCGVGDKEEIEKCSHLTSLDMTVFLHILSMEDQVNFDIEDYKEEEQFGRSIMEEVLKLYEGSMRDIRSSREAFEVADDDLRKHPLFSSFDTYGHLHDLGQHLQCALVRLGVLRRQLKRLYDKKVIEKGFNERFFLVWRPCSYLYFFDE